MVTFIIRDFIMVCLSTKIQACENPCIFGCLKILNTIIRKKSYKSDLEKNSGRMDVSVRA